MSSLTDEQRQDLINAAIAVRRNAHSPYSNFPVGAAVIVDDGEIFSGCNVENVSFGLTNCAERTAVFAAVAAGQKELVGLAVATAGGHTPCGACRQVLSEFADDLLILIVDAESQAVVNEVTLSQLLPDRFSRTSL